jgi:hypothetical protein
VRVKGKFPFPSGALPIVSSIAITSPLPFTAIRVVPLTLPEIVPVPPPLLLPPPLPPLLPPQPARIIRLTARIPGTMMLTGGFIGILLVPNFDDAALYVISGILACISNDERKHKSLPPNRGSVEGFLKVS